MAEDTRKVLIIIVSVSFVAIAIIGLALLFNWPGQGQERRPAGLTNLPAGGNIPGAWSHPSLSEPVSPAQTASEDSPAPASESPAGSLAVSPTQGQTGGDTIVIYYGTKPPSSADQLNLGQDSSTAGGTSQAAGTTTTQSATTTSRTAPAAAATSAAPSSAAPSSAAPSSAAPTSAAPSGTSSGSSATRPSGSSQTTQTRVAAAPASRQEYWIQAASLTNRNRAEDLQQRLHEINLSSVITIIEIDGRPWYRVRIGPYSTKNEADGWLARIRAIPGCEEAYVSLVSLRG